MLADRQTWSHPRPLKKANFDPGHPRGLLQNWPDDVVAVANGKPITRSDILEKKRARQASILANKRRVWGAETVPGFIWTFYNPHFPYTGWHLYVRTLRASWWIRPDRNPGLALKIMRLYPCGLLPMLENFSLWKATFANTFPRATAKRPTLQGMTLARVVVESGRAVDIMEA